MKSKNNDRVLLFKTKAWCWECFPLSVATDGKDGHLLKLEKVGLTFSKFTDIPHQNAINIVSAPWWNLLYTLFITFCMNKGKKNDFSAELIVNSNILKR